MGPAGAVFASSGVTYAYTGDVQSSIIAGVQAGITAGAFYGAGEYIESLGGSGVVDIWTKAGAHAAAGAAAGGINAAIGGGNIGLGALVGGMAGGIGTYAGSYLPSDFASQLAGRAFMGGVIGGVSAEIYGGKFADGFTEGAMTAASAFLFNEMMHSSGKWVQHGPRWYDRHYEYSESELNAVRTKVDSVGKSMYDFAVIQEHIDKFFFLDTPRHVIRVGYGLVTE